MGEKVDISVSAERKFPNDLSAHHIHAGCAILQDMLVALLTATLMTIEGRDGVAD